MLRTKSKKNVITTAVLSLMMVFAMLPSMAFAAANDEASVTINPPSSEVIVNEAYDMTATYSSTVDAHIDWSVTNGTGAATISRHNGRLIGSEAGTVTVTATLREGVAAGGTGGGTGAGGNKPCEGAVLATDTMTITIKASSDYGYQGLSGNAMKLVTPANVLLGDPETTTTTVNDVTYTVYNNQINGEVALTDGTADFTYTLSAGMNTFNKETFDYYKDDIKVLDSSRQVVPNVEINYAGFASKKVSIQVSGLEEGEDYILQFGPSVCGNNVEKKLGCYVEFAFTTE